MTAAAAAKSNGTVVCTAVVCRLAIEVVLGSLTKAVYKLQPNVGLNLLLTNAFMLVTCIIFHILSKLFGFFPKCFGGTWRNIDMQGMKGLIIPTLLLNASLLCKQFVIKGSGPGYAEMIASIGVPLAAIIQYWINGVKIGKLGMLSCIVAASIFFICIAICTPNEIACGFLAALFNVSRAAFTKRSNTKVKLSPGLNLVYTCSLGLPAYFVAAVAGHWVFECSEGQHWTNLFTMFGPIPFFNQTFGLQMFFATLSNLVVFWIYDIASPLTYVISAGLKGITQTLFDVFYIDYFVACLIAALPFVDMDPEKYKNHKEHDLIVWIAFGLKCCYFIIYIVEKIIKNNADKAKKASEAAQAVVEFERESSVDDESSSSD